MMVVGQLKQMISLEMGRRSPAIPCSRGRKVSGSSSLTSRPLSGSYVTMTGDQSYAVFGRKRELSFVAFALSSN